MPDKTEGGEDEATFRVKDRRRIGREEPGQAPPADEPAAAESRAPGRPPGEAEEAEPPLIPVPDLVRIFIGELHARAWMHMGLIVNPATKQVEQDLPQARLAIDCVANLFEQLKPLADPDEGSELERMVADLRLNFVRLSGR